MEKTKPLTAEDLARALKDLPTKKDTKKIVEDSIHNQLSEFHTHMTKPELRRLANSIGKFSLNLEKLVVKMDKLILGFAKLKDGFEGVLSEFAKSPSLRQFRALKKRVEKLEHLPD